MQQQQKKEKKECEVEFLEIPILKKLEPQSFDLKKQLIIYINNSQMKQEQFEQVLKNNQLKFENIDQGLIIQTFTQRTTMLYFQNLVPKNEGIGWLIRAREFLYQICSKEIIDEIHLVFHFPQIFDKKNEDLDQFLDIFRIFSDMLNETNNNTIMSFIQGDNIDQLQMKMNITCQQLFQENVSVVVKSMKIYDCLQFIMENPSYNKINQSPNQVEKKLFQYIQSQLNIIVIELFNEIEIVLSYFLKLLEFDYSDEKNQNFADFRELLLNILQHFPSYSKFSDFLQSKSPINNYFYKLVPYYFGEISVYLTNIIGKNQGNLCQEFQFLSTYKFNFQLQKYIKILQHYEFYLPDDEISINYRYYFQTVEQWVKNYHKQIELKLLKISQIINLNFLKRDDSLKSIFVLGLSKVGKSTLLNIIKDPKNLRIVEDEESNQCFFEAIEEDLELRISSVCISETESLQYFKIQKKMYVDTPGFDDTNKNLRLRNTFNIYQGINNFKQVAFISIFDANEIIQNKTNFLKTIDKFIELVGEEFLRLDLENFFLPIFTKTYPATIEKIKQEWHNIIKDTNFQQQMILNLICSKLKSNNYVEIYAAKHIAKKMDLYKYLDDVQTDINAKCDILFKQQYAFLMGKPKLKLTLQPELQIEFKNLIPQARSIFECIVLYVQEEIKSQLLEKPQNEETISKFLKESQKIVSKKSVSFIDSSEILKEFFINTQQILNFQYNQYYIKLASQYFKFIEVSKITDQEQQFEQEKQCDFSGITQLLMNLQKAKEQVEQLISSGKQQLDLNAEKIKRGNKVQQVIKSCQPLVVLLWFVAAEVCIVGVVYSLAASAGVECIKQKLQKEQDEIQIQTTRLKFQYFLKQQFLEITKKQ